MKFISSPLRARKRFPSRHAALIFLAGVLSLPAAASTQVVAEEVQMMRIANQAEALGTLRANEAVAITATLSEQVSAIHFDDGQMVEAGALLVEMNSAEESALLEEAEVNHREAQRHFDRITQLAANGTASQAQLDEARREANAAEARLAATRSRLKNRIITAPFAGVLGLRNISVGSFVEPGDVITTLTDDSRMKLDFNVPALLLPNITKGLAISAKTPAYPEQEFLGEIYSIDNQVDPVTRSIRVRALLPNEAHLLKQGMLMTVTLFYREREAMVLPEEAVVLDGTQAYVLVAKPAGDGGWTVERRDVTTGMRPMGRVEILSGLQLGEQVITHGHTKIKPGDAVALASLEQVMDHAAF